MNEVVTYSYDSWGKLLSTGGSLASTVGAKNPYRYRGYRYDGETGLYYLQSRYYDPNTGRFLNADDTDELDNSKDSVLSPNLYAYCDNNPVNHTDSNGNWIVDAIFLVADVAEFASHPSWGGAAWILLDCACFVDASGAASAGAHALEAGEKAIRIVEAANEAEKTAKIFGESHKFFKTERAARRAAFRDAGIGKHGERIFENENFRSGSKNPRGKVQKRSTWYSMDRKRKVAHDKYGHKNPIASPHYNVYDEYGHSTHYYYLSKHNPFKNR